MAATKQDIFAKIGDLLLELNDQYATCSEHENCDLIEISLLEAKARFLADHINILKTLNLQETTTNNQQPVHEVTETYKVNSEVEKVPFETYFTPSSQVEKEEVDEQPVHEEIVENMPETTNIVQEESAIQEETIEEYTEANDTEQYHNDITGESEEELVQNSEPEEIVADKAEPQPVQENIRFETPVSFSQPESAPVQPAPVSTTPVQQPEPLNEPPIAEPVVNTVIIEEKSIVVEESVEEKPSRPLTLNELISQQKKAGLGQGNIFQTSQNGTERISDLKVAVSLNDKLLFIKDLFNGYSLAYSEAIELLNRFDNLAEADAFLQTNYALKNGWSDKPQTVEKLYAILRKKFI
ncbi:hypothetical protein ACFU8T_11730 [Sphingobacterium spiritivorum]|uniref:Uncharacterized protein n=1 Tax=Sphingobacterium spiritivorum ATCC 33861 TaxID=525373 RepID=D7VKT6_SPHSI|nr:hypothetical protein [Sphingobacterium spiritivorum]EFK58888.1 hypothetical protein HMPREF0766_11605 [Sphingobacterium spiritivorum ATCC 33861]QQT34238.1 hypothetical protein I6J01_12915 [Sphingobacterium spiritivorum]SUI99324.1 Uncharacterised protein [Sphingobacterium spiritivorum]